MSESSNLTRDKASGRFIAGNIGGGRKIGSRNRLGEQFLRDLAEVWREEGLGALRRCAIEDAPQFCRIVAGLLPRQAELAVDIDVHTQVVDLLQMMRDANGGRADAALERMARKILPGIVDVTPGSN